MTLDKNDWRRRIRVVETRYRGSHRLWGLCFKGRVQLSHYQMHSCQSKPFGYVPCEECHGLRYYILIIAHCFICCALSRWSSRKQPLYFKGRSMIAYILPSSDPTLNWIYWVCLVGLVYIDQYNLILKFKNLLFQSQFALSHDITFPNTQLFSNSIILMHKYRIVIRIKSSWIQIFKINFVTVENSKYIF